MLIRTAYSLRKATICQSSNATGAFSQTLSGMAKSRWQPWNKQRTEPGGRPRPPYRYTRQARGPLQQISMSFRSHCHGSASLLLPADQLDYFQERRRFFGSARLYFRHLLFCYGLHLDYFGREPEHERCRTAYQGQGANYVRFDFRPDALDWEQMRNLARMYGVSVCRLFVLLMSLERERYLAAGEPADFFEAAPIRSDLAPKGRNSDIINSKSYQFLRNLVRNPGAHTISALIMDHKHRKLSRLGQICM